MPSEPITTTDPPAPTPIPAHPTLEDVIPPSGRRVPGVLFVGLGVAALGLSLVILLGSLDRLTIGYLTVALLLVLMAVGLPIGFAMIVSSAIALTALVSFSVAQKSVQEMLFDGVASWTLSVLPLFVIMGVAIWRSGLSGTAYGAARQWIGWWPGGLGIGTTAAGGIMAAASGSTTAITYSLGRMAIPEMLRVGYSPALATGTVAMAGTLGQIIPPSLILVIYAGVAQVPVGPQLLAGVVPGIALGVGFALTVMVWALLRPADAPRGTLRNAGGPNKYLAALKASPILLVGIVVVVGMMGGLFTATESAALGALTALVIGWFSLGRGKRGPARTWSYVKDTGMDAAASIGGLFIIIIGALMLTRALALTGLTQQLTTWIVGLDLGRVWLCILLIAVYIFLGMFLESLPMILLTVPLLQVPLEAAGVDMIWFGIFLVIMCEIGMVFPPIGFLVFVVHRMVQDPKVGLGRRISLSTVYWGIIPFVVAAILLTICFIVWPDIVLWLPNLSG